MPVYSVIVEIMAYILSLQSPDLLELSNRGAVLSLVPTGCMVYVYQMWQMQNSPVVCIGHISFDGCDAA